jgi:hypothetical protein
MRRTMMVLAVVAVLVVALSVPAFAGLKRGIYDTNNGRYVNDYNNSNSTGYWYGSDAYSYHGNGDYRN